MSDGKPTYDTDGLNMEVFNDFRVPIKPSHATNPDQQYPTLLALAEGLMERRDEIGDTCDPVCEAFSTGLFRQKDGFTHTFLEAEHDSFLTTCLYHYDKGVPFPQGELMIESEKRYPDGAIIHNARLNLPIETKALIFASWSVEDWTGYYNTEDPPSYSPLYVCDDTFGTVGVILPVDHKQDFEIHTNMRMLMWYDNDSDSIRSLRLQDGVDKFILEKCKQEM